ncbi:MAG: sigma-54 dependent transcriptional regulator [Cyclobacteriaceae bacterium]|nr:sigma-54 dependent transcriptional regulator [Cyclobacteriaceae bacterium]
MSKILIVDDDPAFCLMLSTFLEKNGFETNRALTAKECLAAVKKDSYDLILTDLRLPDLTGIDLLQTVKEENPALPVVLMTGYGDIKTAVQAIKLGAFEYVTKPINPDEILMITRSALAADQGVPEPLKPDFHYITGANKVSKKLQEYIQLVAPTTMSVLINGESGTGKEYVARIIHQLSKRKDQPFVALDCGALSNELAASELFGHIKGSFTGAINDKAGHFELAHGGTLFLDEIGNLSYEVQIKLLRAIQERSIKRIGGGRDIPVDVRLIAASNEDLREKVKTKGFREDLFHRLNEFSLDVPPLRDREDDIDIFAGHFLKVSNRELGKNVAGMDASVLQAFHQYNWPGNIRELKNVIKRAVLLSDGDMVQERNIPVEIIYSPNASISPSTSNDLKSQTEIQEREIILSTLEKTRYNKSKAAQLLKIDRKTLYNKMKYYQIEG